MLELRVLTLSLVASCFGCASLAAPAPSARLRLLSAEAATVPRPEAVPSEPQGNAPGETPSDAPGRDVTAPRIGAPGGSGAGSRRVAPVQSGKETVGGLPARIVGGTGPAGRG